MFCARRLRGVTVIDWTHSTDDGSKATWKDYYGNRPEWKWWRTAMLVKHGTRLFIEGVSFEIIMGGA